MVANFLSIKSFASGEPNLILLNSYNYNFNLSCKSFYVLDIEPLSILIYPIFFAFPNA